MIVRSEQALPEIAQDALDRIRGILATLFEAAEDAILVMDGDRFVDCNPATLKMFRCHSRGEIVGRTPLQFSPAHQPDGAESAEKVRRFIAAAIDGNPQQFEWQHCRLDGAPFEVDVRLNRFIASGAPFLLSVVRDITARKRAEAALLQEKQFSERLIDSLPGAFYLFDSDLRLRRWRRPREAQEGYTDDELWGKSAESWCPTEESRRRMTALMRSALQHGGATDFSEIEISRKDGAVVPYLLSAVGVDSPTGPMVMGVGIDIAARVQAEKALAASERNYRALFDATNDALLIHDEDGRVLEVNQRACSMFAVDATQARHLTIEDLSQGEPPYSLRDAIEKIHRAMHEGPQIFDWCSKRSDGTLFWSEIALRAFHLEGADRVIASMRDITERKLAAMDRERLVIELEAANSAKDKFLAMVSHEFRNPLAAIQAGADLLTHVANLEESQVARAATIIDRNVKLQARLVGDLLDSSRLMQGRLTVQRAPTQLDDIVLLATEACRADAALADVVLEAHAESGIWVDADDDRIQQALINLIGNAIKFTPSGGRVTVSVMQHESCGRIIVEDTGIGIEADRLGGLFEMFRQGPAEVRKTPGLGIGLAIVKSIVDQHGGRVWVESHGRGRGTRFTIELPLCEPPHAWSRRQTSDAARSDSARPQIKILVVEDNDDTRTILVETFVELAYQVTSADSAETALDILTRESVDVILADIGLPGMNGYEFLRRARRLPSAARCPAFAMTGYGQDNDVQRSLDAGYVEHFVKPITAEQIDRRIQSLVRSNQPDPGHTTSKPH